jgi:hypothetical protein
MKYSLLLIALLSIYSTTISNTLERRGQLGVQLEPVSLEEGKAVVKQVFPNSTAAKIGVKGNDIIISINSKSYSNFKDLLNGLGESKKNNEISLSVERENKVLELSGELEKLPYKVKNEYELSSFEFRNSQIRTIIEKPEGDGPFPVVYYIQGYPCQSCEYTDPNSSIRKFIDDLVNYGYMVYRVEKPNMGDSKGELKCDEIDFDTENAVFAKGYDELLKRSDVDKERITLFGHSMGGWHAPIISNMKSPFATVVYGIRIEDWYDYFLYAMEYQQPLWEGGDYLEGDRIKRKARDYFYQIYFKDKEPEELITSDSVRRFFRNYMNYTGNNTFLGRNSDFFLNLNSKNMPYEWDRINSHVLSMHGEHDLQAIDNSGAMRIVRIVKDNDSKKVAEYKEFSNTEHLFLKVESQKHVARIMQSGKLMEYSKDNYNSDVASYIHNWLTKVAKTNG